MLSVHVRKVKLHPTVVESIKRHAKTQREKGGYEAVGFVACDQDGEVGVATLQLNNHANDPRLGYFVEPWEQFRAERKLADDGYLIMGVYHSHPNAEALPSQADHKLCRPGELAFIYSVVFDDFKAYYEEDGVLIPAEVDYASAA